MLRRSDFCSRPLYPFFSFNDTATTEIYSLSLHDALPISRRHVVLMLAGVNAHPGHAAAVQLRKERAEPVRVLVINGNRLRLARPGTRRGGVAVRPAVCAALAPHDLLRHLCQKSCRK